MVVLGEDNINTKGKLVARKLGTVYATTIDSLPKKLKNEAL